MIEGNLRQKIQNSPDYKNMDQEKALADLLQRVRNYENVYETVADDRQSYIKLINLRSKIICNRIYGQIPYQVVTYLMSIHIGRRPIYLTRSGHVTRLPIDEIHKQENSGIKNMTIEHLNDISISIATTSHCKLNERGIEYAEQLKDELQHQLGKQYGDTKVYTR